MKTKQVRILIPVLYLGAKYHFSQLCAESNNNKTLDISSTKEFTTENQVLENSLQTRQELNSGGLMV